ncbi:hypothetical protein BU25DRAFT_358136 [Macroventuria anomochaeta]|uniref:Uncharacterized protein n=1 Tax=Macroventuria anomochaeta TaxID=301207 RepID=A0ACB6SIG4_9PLEO|nr:uncharacterized protein BU25DRAFT_358136 [Macroventuria anomochaeta]KAF2633099.1 hypothetical protein BU25DRAFT_358136 [Macroventuria anomochaeta]
MPEGRCNYASLKVPITKMPKAGKCRCAGSAPGLIVYMFDKSEVSINDSKGALKSYKDSDITSGNTIIRQFCSNCG